MQATSLNGIPHTDEFSMAGEEHVCTVRVIMPDNTVQAFDATCPTQHAARLIAHFKASFAVKSARELADSFPLAEQDAVPATKRRAEPSGDSSPKSLDVESRVSEPSDEASNDIAGNHHDQYSSSAEDDDELRVDSRKRHAPHTPIAFVPASDTTVKNKTVENECSDAVQTDADEKDSTERSSLDETEPQRVGEVLEVGPLHEDRPESSDTEGGELIKPVGQRKQDIHTQRPHLTPQKRKYSPPRLDRTRATNIIPRSGELAVSERHKQRFRSEPVLASKKHGTSSGSRHSHGSNALPSGKRPKLSVAAGNRKDQKEEATDTRERNANQFDKRHDFVQPSHDRREVHNVELPVTSGPYSADSRIPRLRKHDVPREESKMNMTQPPAYDYTSMYQRQPPHVGAMQHSPHALQMQNSASPFGPPTFPCPSPHHISYASQYPSPPIPPHMRAPYSPTGPPYGASAPGHIMPSTYMQPGYPQPMMAHPIGGFPYQSLPNGGGGFYHPHPQAAYQGPQPPGSGSAQREAEIRATAEEVAARMAAKAAAQDAARNARSDFEADQQAKRAHQSNDVHPGSGKKRQERGEPAATELTKKSDKSGSVTVKQTTSGKDKVNENNTTVDTIILDDGDHTDYVSKLNRMAQKGSPCANLSSPEYDEVPTQNRSRAGQRCTMSVRFIPEPGKEGILITKSVVSTKRRKSKQLVAKEILAEIDSRMESRPQSSDEEDGAPEKAIQTAAQKKNNGVKTAVAALHRLYTLNALRGPPVFKAEEPSNGADGDLWKSVVILDIERFGKHVYEDSGPSKKGARQKCALKAFEALKEMKVPGVETFVNIRGDDKDPENDKVTDEEDAAPIEAIVDVSDDGGKSSLDAEFRDGDDRLMLPKGYKLVFPETEYDCKRWLKENGQSAHLGLFVDSSGARTVFSISPDQKHAENVTGVQSAHPKFLCLSTATSGIVCRFPESPTGDPASDTASPESDQARLPDAIVEILEDSKSEKSGFALEDGMSVLQFEEDFQAQAVIDVATTSLAITGLETVKQSGHLASLPELIRHWLKKEVRKISVKTAWREKGDIPTNLPVESGNYIVVGVLASYACFCIRQQMKQAGRQKRTRMHGVAAAFLQLGEQIMGTAPA